MKKIILILASLMVMTLSAACGSQGNEAIIIDNDEYDSESEFDDDDHDDDVIYQADGEEINIRMINHTGSTIRMIYLSESGGPEDVLVFDGNIEDIPENNIYRFSYTPFDPAFNSVSFQLVLDEEEYNSWQDEFESFPFHLTEDSIITVEEVFDLDYLVFEGDGADWKYKDAFGEFPEDMPEENMQDQPEAYVKEKLAQMRQDGYDLRYPHQYDGVAATVCGFYFPEGESYDAEEFYLVYATGFVYHVTWNGTEDVMEQIGDIHTKAGRTYKGHNGFSFKLEQENGKYYSTFGTDTRYFLTH